jgi:UDP-N-acetyl-D-mannosaminuronate dehydrogenase
MILSGRRTNENMPRYIFTNLLQLCQKKGIVLNSNIKLLILGGSFKENCPDLRNSKIFDLIKEIKKYTSEVFMFDPLIREKLPLNIKKIETLENKKLLNFFDILIVAVPHTQIMKLNFNKKILSLLKKDKRVIIDLKDSFQLPYNDFHF